MIGSLFSGVGGLELGLEWAGLGPVVWQCEQDPYCREVLAKHWPGVPRYDDVRTLTRATVAVRPAILCGGFPCQDISGANANGEGLDGARSGLWFEYLRIIGELAPQAVVVENVARLARRGLDVVGQGLADLGYTLEVARILAADVGAPHLRERLFLVGVRQGMADADGAGRLEPGRRSGEGRGVPPATCGGREGMADADREGQPQPLGAVGAKRGRAVDGGDHELGDTDGARLEVLPGGGDGNEQSAAVRADRRGRAPEPRVGRGSPRLPHWVDGVGPGGAWPSPRGAAAQPWEPPRTAREVPMRPARLRALGNAVVPQCAYVVGLRLRERLEVTP